MPRALAGLKVLDLTRLLPGPYLSLMLADLGADVIKVEAPRGGDWIRFMPPHKDGVGVQFAALNRGKRSIALDLKKPAGVEALKRLAANADVLLEGFRPGVMDRLGVGWDVLSEVNPKLVYCAVTGYGQTGPMRTRAGHDLNYLALSGALGMSGASGGPPSMPGFQLADVAGGSLYGAVGILSALVARQTTGRGRFVDVSMCEGAMSFNVLTLGLALGGGDTPQRGEDQLNGGVACYQVYETSDGKHLSVAPLEPNFWAGFCEAVERPDWVRRHMGDDAAMKDEIAAVLKTKTRAEWVEIFAKVDACVEPILDLDELEAHPQHQERGMFFDQPQGEGTLRQMRTPLVSAADLEGGAGAPKLGEHTAQVLSDAGYSDAEIAELLGAGAATAQA